MRTVPPDLQSDNRRDYPPDLRVVVACAVLRPEARRIRVRDSSSFGNCQKKGSSPQLFRPTPPKGLNPGRPTRYVSVNHRRFRIGTTDWLVETIGRQGCLQRHSWKPAFRH